MNPNDIHNRLAALEAQVKTDRTEIGSLKRRLRAVYAVAALGSSVVFSGAWNREAIAQGYTITLAQAATRIAALESKTSSMSTLIDPNTDKPTVRFSGVNVQIVSGQGTTDEGALNTPTTALSGLGNLIIGYNETGNSRRDQREGIHCLVVGTQNSYRTFGGIVAGKNNTIGTRLTNSNLQGFYAVITGGQTNYAYGNMSGVSGGSVNTASGAISSVSGGNQNQAAGSFASVSGGQGNLSLATATSLSGGYANDATGDYASVSGGAFASAKGKYSSVSGGFARRAENENNWVAGSLIQAK